MSNKIYSLDIENVGGDTYIVMSRGHHDIHKFMKQVREDGYDWPLGVPEHCWVNHPCLKAEACKSLIDQTR